MADRIELGTRTPLFSRTEIGGRVEIGGGAIVNILDNLSNVAAAYSFRRLSSDYEGPIVKLWRQSDSAVMDFNLDGDVVDTSAITTWLGGSAGYVETFYDQNGDAGRSMGYTTRPLYVPNILNGFPVARFNGVNSRMFTSSFAGEMVNAVGNYTEGATFVQFPSIIGRGIAGTPNLGITGSNGTTSLLTSAADTFINGFNTQDVGTLSDFNIFSVNEDAGSPITTVWSFGQERASADRYWGGDISEGFIFSNISSSDRVLLEQNQGSAFGITVASIGEIDVWIGAGQSNMAGADAIIPPSGLLSLANSGLQTDGDRLTKFTYNSNGTLKYNSANSPIGVIDGHEGVSFSVPGFFVHGPEVRFTRDARDIGGIENIGFIKFTANFAALEGGVSPWVKGNDLYTKMAAFIDSSVSELESQGYTVNIKGFIWAQGIDDAIIGRTQAAYETDLTQVISDLRGDYGSATTPFVLMRSVDSPFPVPADMTAVRAGQVVVGDADSDADWINVDDIANVNNHHFSAAGQQTIGARYWSSYTVL